MKKTFTIVLTLAVGAMLLPHAAFAQTWQTVDDFQFAAGSEAAALAITTDPAGNVYSAGYGFLATDPDYAVVNKSGDAGLTWTLSDAGTVNGVYAEIDGIASDYAGNLYAVGNYQNANFISRWFVRVSHDAGLTWTTADDFSLGGGCAEAYGVATDAAGNVYVVGLANTPGVSNPSWIVRKAMFGGTSWSTVDNFSPGGRGAALSVFCHPTQGVFVAGYGFTVVTAKNGKTVLTSTQTWITRKSANGGATWATVDNYMLNSANSYAKGLAADAAGNIYAVGSGGRHGIVRKSATGATWTTVDDFTGISEATGIARDSHGNLFVCGDGGGTWVVRENPGATGGWRTVDTFHYAGTLISAAKGIATDHSGNVFVSGWGYPTTGQVHWLVRKLSAP